MSITMIGKTEKNVKATITVVAEDYASALFKARGILGMDFYCERIIINDRC